MFVLVGILILVVKVIASYGRGRDSVSVTYSLSFKRAILLYDGAAEAPRWRIATALATILVSVGINQNGPLIFDGPTNSVTISLILSILLSSLLILAASHEADEAAFRIGQKSRSNQLEQRLQRRLQNPR